MVAVLYFFGGTVFQTSVENIIKVLKHIGKLRTLLAVKKHGYDHWGLRVIDRVSFV